MRLAGYTWRSNTTLDRPSYFNGNEFFISDEGKMPNVFDLIRKPGPYQRWVVGPLNHMQQNTLGGGDIVRQDTPFVSIGYSIKVGGTGHVIIGNLVAKTPGTLCSTRASLLWAKHGTIY